MKWYVLQVMTGREVEIRDVLINERLPACVPREFVPIRTGGQWVEKEKTFFPGYVFVGSDSGVEGLNAQEYYTAIEVPGVIRFLGTPRPQPITEEEVLYIKWLAPTEMPLQPSVVQRHDGHILDGPLLLLKDKIVKLDKHRRRAKVALSVLGDKKPIEMSIRLEGPANGTPKD
jgi:transcriptional antiterminator NusG